MLKQIKAKDLLFTNDIEDDRTNTFLKLNDYDWMDYQLKTRFRTEEQGILNVTFEYFGFTVSRMNVEQEIQNTEKTKNYIYEFDSNIFKKHIISFLNKHIEQWNDKYAFNGEEIVIEFFNEVLEKGIIIKQ